MGEGSVSFPPSPTDLFIVAVRLSCDPPLAKMLDVSNGTDRPFIAIDTSVTRK